MANLIVFFLALAGDRPESRPVAIVLEVKGSVQLQRGTDKGRPLRALDLLEADDQLQVGNGAAARFVLLVDGTVERTLKGGAVRVGEKGAIPRQSVESVPGNLPSRTLRALREKVRGNRGGLGVLRGNPVPVPMAVAPIPGATVLAERPVLSWPSSGNAEGFQIEIVAAGDTNRAVVWKGTATKAPFPLPKDVKLKPGDSYRWEVRGTKDGNVGAVVGAGEFLLATEALRKAAQPLRKFAESKNFADRVLAAASYEAINAYDEALALYEALAREAPEQARLQAALANYYDRGGQTAKARQARQKASELERAP